MILLDTLLIGGIKFVLNKVAEAVDAELNDDAVLREELLAAQMRLELGEMSDDEFAELESVILARIREIRERTQGPTPEAGEFKITGVEVRATTEDDARDES